MSVSILDLIAVRRDRGVHSRGELDRLALGAAQGTVPDYQLTAWLMAAYLNPLSPQETADLTLAMAASGERLDLTGLPKPWVDKHSTGGVGDKTTLVLTPLLAACGLTVVKMSGRGLGITGGTIDKLESVPGFRTNLSVEEMKEQAGRIGLALTGQTPSLAPADKAFYALRDVTATVPSLPLIVSSILSKKIAGGAETVVLDVKCGRGAFMETLPAAEELARALRSVGELAGLTIRTAITDMDQPLGRTAGNALEVKEAIRVLAGKESGRFGDLCVHLATVVMEAVGEPNPQGKVTAALSSGEALAKAKEWFAAQGGDSQIFESENWQVAPVQITLAADQSGWVERIDARAVGQAVVDLGGGRKTKDSLLNHSVGIETHVEVGSQVESGQPIFTIHAATAGDAESVRASLQAGFTVSPSPIDKRPVILA